MARVRQSGFPKVLVVASDEVSRRAMVRALRDSHEVDEADGAEVASLHTSAELDAVLCAEALGDGAGVGVLARVRRRFPAAVRILVGPGRDPDLLCDAIEVARIHRYVRTPWETADLVTAVSEEIERARRGEGELERATRALGHDLRGPLQTIQGYAELLSMRFGPELDESAGRFLDSLLQGVGRTSELLEAMLDYLAARKASPVAHDVALDKVVAEARANLERRFEEAGAALDIGELGGVRADESLLGRVFEHLLDNAIRYRGDAAPHVRVSSTRRDGMVEITVADDGMGMRPEDAPAAFEPFVRLTSDDTAPGAGVGLAICRTLVEKMGGRITVDTHPGEGSSFSFTLPASESR